MTPQEKILQAAEAIKAGLNVMFRQPRIGHNDGWVELQFLDIDFKIEQEE